MKFRSLVVGCVATLLVAFVCPRPVDSAGTGAGDSVSGSPATSDSARPAQPAAPAPRRASTDTSRTCRAGDQRGRAARIPEPVLHGLPQREDEGGRAGFSASADDGRARPGERGQGPREVGTGRSQGSRGTDAAARHEASRPCGLPLDDRVVRERARSHREAVYAAARTASVESH